MKLLRLVCWLGPGGGQDGPVCTEAAAGVDAVPAELQQPAGVAQQCCCNSNIQ